VRQAGRAEGKDLGTGAAQRMPREHGMLCPSQIVWARRCAAAIAPAAPPPTTAGVVLRPWGRLARVCAWVTLGAPGSIPRSSSKRTRAKASCAGAERTCKRSECHCALQTAHLTACAKKAMDAWGSPHLGGV
jgi:hypothetical protein